MHLILFGSDPTESSTIGEVSNAKVTPSTSACPKCTTRTCNQAFPIWAGMCSVVLVDVSMIIINFCLFSVVLLAVMLVIIIAESVIVLLCCLLWRRRTCTHASGMKEIHTYREWQCFILSFFFPF